ncbi:MULTISPECIES: iron-siderophore ABC transporter substrate-binding protein [unclassified Vibrio]|uniref:iron-siderophore ABC transporter substrate-binding protein n=1 Tax=unclassified Vibrio TaxID=2614977 RepID=UPI001483219D|nr:MULTISPECIES: iron-siderophore ABC transporter substrate-binding protein [unclassified Vibrio]MDQ2193079.1 iron-siderophore ABC transporter substrate-binding protein [Vibrio sp. A14(2019)]MDQ2197112.1 iron-siderophore ABC transporter substrate-binding protein [Vibrio sp. 2017_1457_11]NNN76183.1 iron-siderophore ABC transporter substrate-binding protein [Vibrio sp. B7]NNN92774.1 iron-siderophore ABC transporter substrate-binding protein [Vibrio sp. B8-1]NNO08375.1 iron-siderophore ABC transp
MCLNLVKRWLVAGLLSVFSSVAFSAPLTVHDSRGEQTLQQRPQRVVVLNWDLLEQVIELGITPVGAPELASYQDWVVKPQVPQGVEDIGTRVEPNLEKIAALKPDLILAAAPQQDLITPLERIAPVLYFSNFQASDDSGAVAIDHFRQLAQLFDKQALVEQKLTTMTERFAQLKAQIGIAFSHQTPAVVAMRFANPTSVFLYGENSTTHYVLKQLGLHEALPQPAKEWGIVQHRLTDLQYVEQGYVLYFLPFAQQAQLEKSMLWQAMPFVRQARVNSVESVWNYGGAMSLQYIAEALTRSLLEVAPKS